MELFLFCLGVVAAVLALGSKFRQLRMPAWVFALMLGLAVLAVTSAFFWEARAQRQIEQQHQFSQTIPRQGRPGGYVSSDTCQACHPSQYASWHRSYHRTMTQYASPESVVGQFDGQELPLLGYSYSVERRAGEFWVDLPDRRWRPAPGSTSGFDARPRLQRRVGLVTGSHHMQVYWVPLQLGNLQMDFPWAWLISDQRWVPVDSTFLRDPNLPLHFQSWNTACSQCHSTGSQPRIDTQVGSADTRTGELGIACEACHGPAEEHVRINQNPLRRYALHLGRKPDPTIVNPVRCTKKYSAQICGQCHGIKWLPQSEPWQENGFSFRPGRDLDQTTPIVRPTKRREQPWITAALSADPTYLQNRYWSDGMVRVSGRDYNGLVESPCYQRGEMTCLSCHSMHQSQPENQLAAGMDSDEACLQCHSSLRKQIAAHSHHPLGSSGAACYNCHMPFTTYGLMKAIRSHQVSSPTVQSSLETGRPNACNLCHLDKPLEWTARFLNQWYDTPSLQLDESNRTTSAALLWLLRGDAGQRALVAWHMGWEPARRASGQLWLEPFLAQLFDDPYPTVRYIAYHSLERLPGFSQFDFDFLGPEPDRARARQKALELWRRTPATALDRTGPAVLLDQNGLQAELVNRLLSQRDDRSMDLQE